MLTTHKKTPRGRALAGTAGVAGLILAGLALTASGTAAAGAIRVNVEKATGIDLDKVALPGITAPTRLIAAHQDDVPAPGAVPPPVAGPVAPPPAGAPAPVPAPAPLAAPAPVPAPAPAPGDIRIVHTKVIRDADGKDIAIDDDGPDISSGKCGLGGKDASSTTTWKTKDGKARQRVMICVDRIERDAKVAAGKAMQAQMDAGKIEKMAKLSALTSLASARAAIESAQGLDKDQRLAALSGIDEALKELQNDIDHPDSDD